MQGKRVPREEFIARGRVLYGDRFDYSQVEYTKLADYITITCTLHGVEFSTTAKKHLEGRASCSLCSRPGKITITHVEKALSQAGVEGIDLSGASIAHHGDHPWIEDFICSLHGESLSASYTTLLRGATPCLGCRGDEKVLAFISASRERRGENALDYSRVNMDTLNSGVVELLCQRHGVLYSQSVKAHGRGNQGCPICGNGPLSRSFNLHERIATGDLDSNVVPGSVRFTTESNTTVELECREHGAYRQRYRLFMEGRQGCRQCRGRATPRGVLKQLLLAHFSDLEENTSSPRVGKIHFYSPSRGIAFQLTRGGGAPASELTPLELDGRRVARAEDEGITLYIISRREVLKDEIALGREIRALGDSAAHRGTLWRVREGALRAWEASRSAAGALSEESNAEGEKGRENGVANLRGNGREDSVEKASSPVKQNAAPRLYPPGKEKLQPGVNDLATINPPWIGEWSDDRDPGTVFYRAVAYYFFTCPEGHEYKRAPRERHLGMGCPECPVDWSERGKITLEEKFPALAMELANTSLGSVLSPHSHEAVQWRCTTHEWHHHVYFLSPNQRAYGRDCPHCAFREPLAGFNDIAGVMPSLLGELVEKEHGALLANSKGKIPWQHVAPDGVVHSWEASPYSRVYEGSGCLICAGKQVNSSNSFQERFLASSPYEWSEGNEFSPESITWGSSKMITLTCPLHITPNVMTARAKFFTSGRKRCRDCEAGSAFVSGKERAMAQLIAEEFPGLAMETSVRRYRSQGIHEIDVLLEGRIAVEFNGTYWHQEGVFKPVGYHDEKRRTLSQLGISLYEVEEGEWDGDGEKARRSLVEYIRGELAH